MYHNTYDRVRGSWWGAIVAQSLLNQLLSEPQARLHSQSWLIQRQKLATSILKQELSVGYLQKLIADLALPITNLQHNSSLLSLLPAIVFPANKSMLQLKNIVESNLKSANEPIQIAINQDALGWEYLLTSVLSCKLDLVAQKRVIRNVIEYRLGTSGLLANKLGLVAREIENGSSLGSIVEQLSPLKGFTSTAIALAWYCFATTPQDFRLSIKRASLVATNFAWLTIALTGTLSGAYNGMAEISAFGRTEGENPQEQLERHLCEKLSQDWLGIYAYERRDLFYNHNLEAIALPGLIQTRQSLKIVSQKLI